MLFKLLASGVSMRRSAFLLDIHQTTVARKLVYLATKARLHQADFLKSIRGCVQHMQFDDLITIEHTKMKPLTVSIAVDRDRRHILGAVVGRIPAFGLLAERSRHKYGPRPNDHRRTLSTLFRRIGRCVSPSAIIESDEHALYPERVSRFFPLSTHIRYKGERGCIAGQGELKKVRYDPLFTLNHSCAMLRANVNRLIRRTWCTTKRPDRLQHHLDLYVDFHNTHLIH